MVVAIERDHELLLPRGSSKLEPSDLLYLLVERDRLHEVRAALQRAAAQNP